MANIVRAEGQINAMMENVSNRIAEMQTNQGLDLPPDYSAANALKSARLILETIKNKDGAPVLQSCSAVSICNALLNMVVQGLNPAKNQCYFIPYGNTLTMQRSYFGTQAIAFRVVPNLHSVTAQVVCEGEEFEFETVNGRDEVAEHKRSLKTKRNEIIGAYAIMLDKEGNTLDTEIMTIDDIHTSWKQSRAGAMNGDNVNPNSVHGKFTEEMCRKTVISRLLKRHINSSSDNYLLLDSMRKADAVVAVEQSAQTIDAEANVIDIEDVDVDKSTGEIIDVHYADAENAPEVIAAPVDAMDEPDF